MSFMKTGVAQDLHNEFMEIGRSRHILTHKLLAILPEIYRSKIYRKYASSIFEYANRFGGLSDGVVRKTLNLSKKIPDNSLLAQSVEIVGVHKVDLVASLVTPDTEELWVKRMRTMSKSALQALTKEIRKGRVDQPIFICIQPDTKLYELFNEFKLKFPDYFSSEFVLESVLGEIDQNKLNDYQGKIPEENVEKNKRYIPVRISKKLSRQCVYPGCNKDAREKHHRQRFSEGGSHESIVPLCHCHHEFAHHGLIDNEINPPQEWCLNWKTQKVQVRADVLYRKFKAG